MRSFEQELVKLFDYEMIAIFLKHPLCVCVCTHTHTHTHTQVNRFICKCVCLYVYMLVWKEAKSFVCKKWWILFFSCFFKFFTFTQGGIINKILGREAVIYIPKIIKQQQMVKKSVEWCPRNNKHSRKRAVRR